MNVGSGLQRARSSTVLATALHRLSHLAIGAALEDAVRSAEAGGRACVESAPGEGVRVELRWPE
ncbi:hypothetical protein ABZW30_19085 [Kitasatospora sp. NPDC004669]|uniref:hypothetical protein n=1 Tax=Kitasatospora sp. NPDC004669 TaxID=3154555 RepID=UPI0033BF0496